MDILLINIADVRKFTNLTKNVDSARYKQYIISAQNIQLKNIIGSECLEDLLNAKCSNTLDQYQTALLELVKPYLINSSYAKYVFSSPITSTAEGLVKLEGDNITHLTNQEKKQEFSFYDGNANEYEKQIIELLESDKDNYPCYHTSGKCSCCKTNNSRTIFDL